MRVINVFLASLAVAYAVDTPSSTVLPSTDAAAAKEGSTTAPAATPDRAVLLVAPIKTNFTAFADFPVKASVQACGSDAECCKQLASKVHALLSWPKGRSDAAAGMVEWARLRSATHVSQPPHTTPLVAATSKTAGDQDDGQGRGPTDTLASVLQRLFGLALDDDAHHEPSVRSPLSNEVALVTKSVAAAAPRSIMVVTVEESPEEDVEEVISLLQKQLGSTGLLVVADRCPDCPMPPPPGLMPTRATPASPSSHDSHTVDDQHKLPLFATGPGSENLGKITNMLDVPEAIAKAMGGFMEQQPHTFGEMEATGLLEELPLPWWPESLMEMAGLGAIPGPLFGLMPPWERLDRGPSVLSSTAQPQPQPQTQQQLQPQQQLQTQQQLQPVMEIQEHHRTSASHGPKVRRWASRSDVSRPQLSKLVEDEPSSVVTARRRMALERAKRAYLTQQRHLEEETESSMAGALGAAGAALGASALLLAAAVAVALRRQLRRPCPACEAQARSC